MTKFKDAIKTAAPIVFLVLAACQNQQPTPSQAIADCLSSPGCPTTISQYTNGANGNLQALGQTYTVPTVGAQTPALTTPVGVASAVTPTGAALKASNVAAPNAQNSKDIKDAASGDNAFAKVAGANAAMAADNWQVGAAVKQQAATETPSSAARVMSASELGQDPTDGSASAR